MLPIYFVGEWHHKNRNGLQLLKDVRPWNGERDGIILTNELNMDIVCNYERVIVGPGVEFKFALNYFKNYQGDTSILFNTL